ncbi:flavodoxin [Clostridium novyi A str. 4552]|uniref:Flavodoxin n=1 Tax=Clostridium novyi A str. 4552 TaxID=1444289 RepID=A0A0A0ICG5_CLONO|nr:flavodoxin [Clostridium novyi]KGM97230.1 flavodoxin [Clostridium novyi A str. 4552]
MKELVIIYWSGTGNTESMANAVAEGAKIDDVNVKLMNVSEAKVEDIENADSVALGCPSMGAEQLEEAEMEPFVDSISSAIKGKKLVLFGSYGWGNGEWMEDWEERMTGYGANVVDDCLIINNTPDDEGIEKCKELGETLAKA